MTLDEVSASVTHPRRCDHAAKSPPLDLPPGNHAARVAGERHRGLHHKECPDEGHYTVQHWYFVLLFRSRGLMMEVSGWLP